MATSASFKMSGFKELEDALLQLPKSLAKSALRSALIKVAQPMIQEARERAPKDTPTSKGGAESIGVHKDLKYLWKKTLHFTGSLATGTLVIVSIGPDRKHFYMQFAEWGTSKQAAHPFMRPAWDNNKESIRDNFGKELWKILAKKAATLAKKAGAGTLGKRTIEHLRGL